MTRTDYAALHPDRQPRYLAWCMATGHDPKAKYENLHEFIRWVSRNRVWFAESIYIPRGNTLPSYLEPAFTDYLWAVAEAGDVYDLEQMREAR